MPHTRIISQTPYRGVQNRTNLHDGTVFRGTTGGSPLPAAQRWRREQNDERRRPCGKRLPAEPGGQAPRDKRGPRSSRLESPAFPQPAMRKERQVTGWRRAGRPSSEKRPAARRQRRSPARPRAPGGWGSRRPQCSQRLASRPLISPQTGQAPAGSGGRGLPLHLPHPTQLWHMGPPSPRGSRAPAWAWRPA